MSTLSDEFDHKEQNLTESKSFITYFRIDADVPGLPAVQIRNPNMVKLFNVNSFFNKIWLSKDDEFKQYQVQHKHCNYYTQWSLSQQQYCQHRVDLSNVNIKPQINGNRIFDARILSFDSMSELTKGLQSFVMEKDYRINYFTDNKFCFIDMNVYRRRFWSDTNLALLLYKFMQYCVEMISTKLSIVSTMIIPFKFNKIFGIQTFEQPGPYIVALEQSDVFLTISSELSINNVVNM